MAIITDAIVAMTFIRFQGKTSAICNYTCSVACLAFAGSMANDTILESVGLIKCAMII